MPHKEFRRHWEKNGDGILRLYNTRYLAPSLSNEIWQFQPLSRPIFSEKTRERSSFSLLKWTNLMHALSSCSISCTCSHYIHIHLTTFTEKKGSTIDCNRISAPCRFAPDIAWWPFRWRLDCTVPRSSSRCRSRLHPYFRCITRNLKGKPRFLCSWNICKANKD